MIPDLHCLMSLMFGYISFSLNAFSLFKPILVFFHSKCILNSKSWYFISVFFPDLYKHTVVSPFCAIFDVSVTHENHEF